jgi:hypothetical protein
MIDRAREFEEFQRYMAEKRANFAPDFGGTIVASMVTLGVVDIAQPNTEFHEKEFSNTYSPRIGAIALENQLGPKPTYETLTPHIAALGQAEQFTLAA